MAQSLAAQAMAALRINPPLDSSFRIRCPGPSVSVPRLLSVDISMVPFLILETFSSWLFWFGFLWGGVFCLFVRFYFPVAVKPCFLELPIGRRSVSALKTLLLQTPFLCGLFPEQLDRCRAGQTVLQPGEGRLTLACLPLPFRDHLLLYFSWNSFLFVFSWLVNCKRNASDLLLREHICQAPGAPTVESLEWVLINWVPKGRSQSQIHRGRDARRQDVHLGPLQLLRSLPSRTAVPA